MSQTLAQGVRRLDPLKEPDWDELVSVHPKASIFHSSAWLRALHATYQYEPFVLTTSHSNTIENGLPGCIVHSRLTGRRIVSLPFSDHCLPIADEAETLQALVTSMAKLQTSDRFKYSELRIPDDQLKSCGFGHSDSYCLHRLDLRPSRQALFARLHPTCIRAKVRRAGKEQLNFKQGTSESLLQPFFQLLTRTRRRHGLPPQPFRWFRNLLATMGSRLLIHLATLDRKPVGGVLTLRHGRTLFYKYGASEPAYNRLGVMPALFWRIIEGAKAEGLTTLDLGRSDWDQPGLIQFKDRLGGKRSTVHHYRFPPPLRTRQTENKLRQLARSVLGRIPEALLPLTGRVLYRHFG